MVETLAVPQLNPQPDEFQDPDYTNLYYPMHVDYEGLMDIESQSDMRGLFGWSTITNDWPPQTHDVPYDLAAAYPPP